MSLLELDDMKKNELEINEEFPDELFMAIQRRWCLGILILQTT